MKQWEYEIEVLPIINKDMKLHLNVVGYDHWELVSVTQDDNGKYILIFKREILEPKEPKP